MTTRSGPPIPSISNRSSQLEAASIAHSGNASANNSPIKRRVNGLGSINAIHYDDLSDPSSLSLSEEEVAIDKHELAVFDWSYVEMGGIEISTIDTEPDVRAARTQPSALRLRVKEQLILNLAGWAVSGRVKGTR